MSGPTWNTPLPGIWSLGSARVGDATAIALAQATNPGNARDTIAGRMLSSLYGCVCPGRLEHHAYIRQPKRLDQAGVKDSAFLAGVGHGEGTGRCRTICGHQNHLPSSVAMDGVMSDRTTSVSKSRPSPIVVPTWPMTVSWLTDIVIIVNANSSPAEVTTDPVPPIDRMIPVFKPAWISSLNRDTNSRL